MSEYIRIPMFGGGLITNMDPEDLPVDSCSDTTNVDIEVPGKITKRKPRKLAHTISGANFKQLMQWTAPHGVIYWVGYETQNKDIELYNSDFSKQPGGTNIVDYSATSAMTDVKIINFGDELRIAGQKHEKAKWISNLTRRYFFDAWQPALANSTDTSLNLSAAVSSTTATSFSVDGGALTVQVGDYLRVDTEVVQVTAVASADSTNHTLTVTRGMIGSTAATHSDDASVYFANTLVSSDATITYPTTWEYQDISQESSSHGTNGTGYYYYKFTAIFDGNQELPLGESFASYNLTTANKPLKIGLKIDTDDFSRRITGINIYKSYLATDHTPVYTLAKSIPVNTKSTYTTGHVATSSTSNVGSVVYTPDANFVSGDVNKWVRLHKTNDSLNDYYYIGARTSKTITLTKRYVHGSGLVGSFIGLNTTAWADASGYVILPDNGSGTAPNVSDWTNASGSAISGGARDATLYFGLNTVYDTSWDFDNDDKNDWIAKKSSSYRVVDRSFETMVRVTSNFSSYGVDQSITLTNGYYFTSISSGELTLYVYDPGIVEAGAHPLGAKTKVTTNYKYGQWMNGRYFVGNVRLDPGIEDEDHENWIIYSELNQPDILPISNYIQIKDVQGGKITGLSRLFDDLVVLMENGIFRLSVPYDPSTWSLLESDENVGCIAPNSIVKAGSYVFFAGQDHIYAVDANFNSFPISEPIRDDYQNSSNLTETRGVYDPKKQRILFMFGSTTRYMYSLQLNRFKNGEFIWNKHDLGTTIPANELAIDNDLNIYTIQNNVS